MEKDLPGLIESLSLREKVIAVACGSVMLAQVGVGVATVTEALHDGPSDPETRQTLQIVGAAVFGGALPSGLALVGGFAYLAVRQYRRENS